MRKVLLALLLLFVPGEAARATYTINHGLCVNATVSSGVVAKDCGGIPLVSANNLSDILSASTARANLGLIIGTNVQAWDADLDAFSGLTSAGDRLPYFTSSHAMALATFTSFGRSLVDDADAATARTTLGLAVGTNVEAWDADLDALAALSSSAGIVKRTGAGTFGLAAAGADFAPATSGTAALLGNGSGGFSNYAGGTCINRFIRSLSAAVAPTCASVANADMTNSAVTLNGHSLSLGAGLTLAFSDFSSDYAEGTWTPTDASGASLSLTSVDAAYTKVGRMVFAYFTLTYPSTASGSTAVIGGLPLTVANRDAAQGGGSLSFRSAAGPNTVRPIKNTTTFAFYSNAGVAQTNTNMTTVTVSGMLVYPTTP
ncbi:MAG: hypothetical protein WDM91_10850 [Rhizomicrobium sp.]